MTHIMRVILIATFFASMGCTKTKKDEITPAQKLKNDHANLVMNTSIARRAFDLTSAEPEKKICGLDEDAWSKQIKKMVDQRSALPKLSPTEMDQIDRSMNHMLCDEKCMQEFCNTQL
jgi:hypothetical protein